MSSQSASARREAALAAAAKLGPMNNEVAEAIAQQRERYAEKRAARVEVQPIERRVADRRAGPFDRRQGERRFATMDDKLAARHERQKERVFTGEPISGFGDDV